MADAPENVPNVVIEVDRGEVTAVSTDRPDLLGQVVVVDRTEVPEPAAGEEIIPTLISQGYEGTVGYRVAVEEDVNIATVIKEIMEADAKIEEEESVD